MNNAFGHIPEDLLQQAHDAWEFTRCQRPDGSYYGTGGVCRKGSQVDAKEKAEKAGASKKDTEYVSKYKGAFETVAEDTFLKNGGLDLEHLDPGKISKNEAKQEMTDVFKISFNKANLSDDLEPGDLKGLSGAWDSKGEVRTVQTAPVTRVKADSGNNKGGWEMGINGTTMRATQTLNDYYVVTMES